MRGDSDEECDDSDTNTARTTGGRIVENGRIIEAVSN